MKSVIFSLAALLSGCAVTNDNYQRYLEQNAKLQQSLYAAESACLLVLAEAVKSADPVSKAAITNQVDKCRKDQVQLKPPKPSIFNLFN